MIDFDKYEKLAIRLSQEASLLWSKVSFITVAEILEGTLDLSALDRACWNLKDRASDFARRLSREVDSMPEDEYFDRSMQEYDRVSALFDEADNRLDLIDTVVYKLREIEEKMEESDASSLFQDIRQVNLGESIRLQRFN